MKLFGLKLSSKPSAPAPSVQFAPGDAFFTRRFDLPPGTEAGEVAGFVELQLEEISPFPLDQLHHGYLRASDGASVFVFAAYRRRFAPELSALWPQSVFVLPDFAPALCRRFKVETVVLFRTDTSLTALRFEDGRELPACMASRPLAADAGDDIVASVSETLLRLVGGRNLKVVEQRLGPPPLQRAQGLAFLLTDSRGEPEADETLLALSDCWTMDIREAEFVSRQRKRLGVDLIFWRVIQAGAAAAVLLIAGELLLLAGLGATAWMNGRVRDRAPEAQQIADRKSLAVGLAEFRGRALRPFEVFRVAGRGTSDRVYLTTSTLDGRKMEADGAAVSVADLNSYLAALKSAAEIASVEERNVTTKDNLTTFKLLITFKPDAFPPLPGAGAALAASPAP